MAEKERTFTERELQSVLRRLAGYYKARAKVALKVMREQSDAQSACTHALAASQWAAKYDAVMKVAENLEIALDNESDG